MQRRQCIATEMAAQLFPNLTSHQRGNLGRQHVQPVRIQIQQPRQCRDGLAPCGAQHRCLAVLQALLLLVQSHLQALQLGQQFRIDGALHVLFQVVQQHLGWLALLVGLGGGQYLGDGGVEAQQAASGAVRC